MHLKGYYHTTRDINVLGTRDKIKEIEYVGEGENK